MGFFDAVRDNFQEFVFSLTTNDRYASSNSPYVSSSNQNSSQQNFMANNNQSTASVNSNNVIYTPGLRSRTIIGEVPLNDFVNGLPPAPPIQEIWERLENFFDENYVELYDNLSDPATAADLNELENDLNCTLPLDIRESWQIHDGQERPGKPTGVIMGLTLLDIESIVEEYGVWQTAAKRINHQKYLYDQKKTRIIAPPKPGINFVAHQHSIPEGSIQPTYVHPGWIPLAKDFSGNNIAVDLAPGPKGKWGQIIVFGHDFDTKFVISSSWSDFLNKVVTEYENDEYLLDERDGESEIWYKTKDGRILSYLDALKNKALAPYRRQQQQQQQQKGFRRP
ncbi:SMI1/KNR4 family protein, partial [Ascoidea rubescens DSM 1968]